MSMLGDNFKLNEYQKELARLLKLSTLTPANYMPSPAVKSGTHAAVFVNGAPFLITGPADDMKSMTQARLLSESPALLSGLQAMGLFGEPEYGTVKGESIDWQISHSSVASSVGGHVESGNDVGDLMAIVIGDNSGNAFAVLMCINTDLAKIIDPSAPALDDGKCLTGLARKIRLNEFGK